MEEIVEANGRSVVGTLSSNGNIVKFFPRIFINDDDDNNFKIIDISKEIRNGATFQDDDFMIDWLPTDYNIGNDYIQNITDTVFDFYGFPQHYKLFKLFNIATEDRLREQEFISIKKFKKYMSEDSYPLLENYKELITYGPFFKKLTPLFLNYGNYSGKKTCNKHISLYVYHNIARIMYPEIGMTMLGRHSADFRSINVGDTITVEPILFYGTKDGNLTWYKRDSLSRNTTDINMKFIFKLYTLEEIINYNISAFEGKSIKSTGKISHHLIDRD